jgi:hypothetical protein
MENIQELISKTSKGRKAKIYSGVNISKLKIILQFLMMIIIA